MPISKLSEKTKQELIELLNEAYTEKHDSLAVILELELLRRELIEDTEKVER